MSAQSSKSWLDLLFRNVKKTPGLKGWLIGILVGVGGIGLLYLIYSIAFLGQIYPRASVSGVKLGGLTQEQAQTALTQAADKNLAQTIKLTYNDRSYDLAPVDVGWSMDAAQTAQDAYQYGRHGQFLSSLGQQLIAPLHARTVDPVVTVDNDKLSQKISDLAKQIDQPAIDASAKFVGDKLTITREQSGRRLQIEAAKLEILHQWAHFQPSTVVLETKFETPKIVAGSSDELAARADALVAPSYVVTWPDGKKTLSKRDLRTLIEFVGVDQTLTSTDEGLAQQTLSPQFGQDKVKNFVGELAKGIDRPAKDPKLVIKDGALSVESASAVGSVVDIETSVSLLLAAFSQKKDATVALTITTQNPVITESNLEPLGIKERIGFAETSFTGSPANRRANIINGVKILQSALVKPGDEFSTVKTLGAVDDTTGFLPELVIKENRTTPEFGGGLCQVSTTLFRAVMNAGLKVTERQNHSYRVGYYEPPVGMDATIYLPKPDFFVIPTI
jgi:vancomycin resistance protein YoaR